MSMHRAGGSGLTDEALQPSIRGASCIGRARARRLDGLSSFGDQSSRQDPQLFAWPITDAVNLGTLALRAGKKVLFDSGNMKITNAADANKYPYRPYRPGWEL